MLINCDSIGSGGRGVEEGQVLSWVSCLFVFGAFVGCFDLVPLVLLPTLSDASAGRHLPNVPHASLSSLPLSTRPLPLASTDAPLYIIQGRLLYAWEKQLNKEQGQDLREETNVKL